MKGLLCKDWAILMNSYKKNFLIMVVLYLGMAVCLHMDYLCYALVAVCGVYASSTMNFDDSAHWDTYARTLPVTPGDRKSTRLNSSHKTESRMPSSA